MRGKANLSIAAQHYRTCLGDQDPSASDSSWAAASSALPQWHALHAACALSGLLVGQGLLLEATKLARRAVLHVEPLLRKVKGWKGSVMLPSKIGVVGIV